MASEEPYDATDVTLEEDDSDTEAPAPKKVAPAGDGSSSSSGGKGFGAVRPYAGAIVAPSASSSAAIDKSAPDTGLTLEWAYGFRSHDSKSNIAVNSRGSLVYPVAGLVVVYNRVKNEQTHYMGHNDDVKCLAQHPTEKDWMISGQVASIGTDGKTKAPYACVWNSTDFTQSFQLPLDVKSRAVRSVAFSPCGNFVVLVGNDDNHTVSIWDWKKTTQVVAVSGGKENILQIKFNHVLPSPGIYELVTVGAKHAFFYTFDSHKKELKSKRVTLGGAFPMQTWNSVTFSEKGHACLGGFDGTILICKVGTNGTASKALAVSPATGSAKAAKVFSLDTYQGGIVAGLSDKTVVIFDSKLVIKKVFEFKQKVTTVYVRGKDLIVGTQASHIFELKNGLDDSVAGGSVEGRFEPLTAGHYDGELWGVALFKDGEHAITAGEDNTLLLWNIKTHQLVKKGVIAIKAGLAPKVKKASTTSLHPQNQCARCIQISPDQTTLAVGTNNGFLNLYDAKTLAFKKKIDLNKHGQRKVTNAEGEWIQTIEYSPDGRTLAVGTHGSVIVLLDATSPDYTLKAVINSHHSFLTHMDWSSDSTKLRSNDGAYELLYHDASAGGKQITSASAVKDVDWATNNCVFTWGTHGVIHGDGNEVNSVARVNNLLFSADDLGKVNVYRYPAPSHEGVSYLSYHGHCSHVTTVRLTPDGTTLLSTGGHDLALLAWKVGPYKASKSGRTHQVNRS